MLKVDPPEQSDTAKIRRFGSSLFDREVSTFAPTDNAPVPDTYRLGVGDQLTVQLFGTENQKFNLQVGRSGDINFPKLGAITVLGLTFEDARDLIKSRVSQQLIGVEASISLGRLRAINIFMAGEISVPGAYSVSALTTVTNALFQAGGITDIGSLRNIQVLRGGVEISRFDAYDLLMRGDATNDTRLQSGDVVFVPTYEGMVLVEGELKRPMMYEVLDGETLANVIQMAGGFTSKAFPALSTLTINADSLGLSNAVSVNLLSDEDNSIRVFGGETLRVPPKSDLVAETVRLTGAVTRPGLYGWDKKLRISSLLADVKRDLSRNADSNVAYVIRLKPNFIDIEVIQFSLNEALGNPGGEADLLLNEFDEVLILATPYDSEDLTVENSSREVLLEPVMRKLRNQAAIGAPLEMVSISGAVRSPGSYPLAVNATIEDLITAAGGMTDAAFTEKLELRRLREKPGGLVESDYKSLQIGGLDLKSALQSRDHLTVREIPDWSQDDSIVLSGEFVFPGEYRISRGERLADVIQRAGGLTSEAAARSAIFTRVAIAQLQSEQANAFARQIEQNFATRMLTEEAGSRSLQEITLITEALRNEQGAGRLLIDMEGAMRRDAQANIVVQDGDSLFVPKQSNVITVIGEVRKSASHTYQKDLSLRDYIEMSAGYTARADKKAMYLVKGSGQVVTYDKSLWQFTPPELRLESGDTIVVPINTEYKDSLSNWTAVTQLIYQSMVSVAAVVAL
jgi:polysaccharide export outer membrane protein